VKTIKIVIIILIGATVLSFVKSGQEFHIAKLLPFCDGEPVNRYHLAGLVMCVIALWSYYRLRRRDNND